MTPSLIGRWQTRLAMLATIGAIVTAIFFFLHNGDVTFWYVLLWVFVLGVGWDIIYIGLQEFRWDRDWPAAFQWAAGIWEGFVLYLLIRFVGLPGIAQDSVPLGTFIAHYGIVWILIYIWVQGPMRAMFPFWRFHGGRIG